MYSIENFCAFNVHCFSNPQTFFSELLSIYGILRRLQESFSVLLTAPTILLINTKNIIKYTINYNLEVY